MFHGNRASARAFADRFDVDKLGNDGRPTRNRKARILMKKMADNGLEPVFYNAPCAWDRPGQWVEPDGRGGPLVDQSDEPRQWWPEALSIGQVPEVANQPIPRDIPITTEPTLAELEAFIRTEGVTAIVAHSQGGHVAELLMLRLERGGNNPIERVVLMSTYNSYEDGDRLETPALVYHCKDDAVVPFACCPTVGDGGLWANGVHLHRETGGHHISGRMGDWTDFCTFLGTE